MPPNGRGRPAKAASASIWGGGQSEHSRLIPVDPVIVRLLASTTPCPLCDDRGLCWRCWRVARAVEELVVAARVDQAVDVPVLAVAA